MQVISELSQLMHSLADIKNDKLKQLRPQLESLLIAMNKGEVSLSEPEQEMLTRAIECISVTDSGINNSLFNLPATDNDKLAAMPEEARKRYILQISADFDNAANQLVEHVRLMHQLISFNVAPAELASLAAE